MTTREALHQIIDELPEADLQRVQLYVDYLRSGGDPLLHVLLTAPDDDEPLSPEDEKAIAEGLDALNRGETVTLEEPKRELGL